MKHSPLTTTGESHVQQQRPRATENNTLKKHQFTNQAAFHPASRKGALRSCTQWMAFIEPGGRRRLFARERKGLFLKLLPHEGRPATTSKSPSAVLGASGPTSGLLLFLCLLLLLLLSFTPPHSSSSFLSSSFPPASSSPSSPPPPSFSSSSQ